MRSSVLKDITRTWNKRPPVFTPTWPAESQGRKSFYSFSDLMKLTIIVHARQAKIERAFIVKLMEMAKRIQEGQREKDPSNPFNPYYLTSKGGAAIGLANHVEYLDGSRTSQFILELQPGPKYLISNYIHTNPEDKTEDYTFDIEPYKQTPKNLEEIRHLNEQKMTAFKLEAGILIKINLNQIHYLVKQGLRDNGLL